MVKLSDCDAWDARAQTWVSLSVLNSAMNSAIDLPSISSLV